MEFDYAKSVRLKYTGTERNTNCVTILVLTSISQIVLSWAFHIRVDEDDIMRS